MGREWKIGDWLEWNGERYLVVDSYKTAGASRVDLLNRDKYLTGRVPVNELLVHLPECTGWDRQPPKPIELHGDYRWLEDGEIVRADDLACDSNPPKRVHHTSVGKVYESEQFVPIARKIIQLREGTWYELKNGRVVGPCNSRPMDEYGHCWKIGGLLYRNDGSTRYHDTWCVVREVESLEPKYRPFASAEEFAQHREKWVLWKNGCKNTMRIGAYEDRFVTPATGEVGVTFAKAFELWEFEDGSPFGVLVEPA